MGFDSSEYEYRISKSYQLLSPYSYLTGIPLYNLSNLADRLVDRPPRNEGGVCGESGLNADHSPLQLCITTKAKKIQCRLIADPATDEAILERRYLRAQEALTKLIPLTRSDGNATLIASLLENFGPQNNIPVSLFRYGVFWLGASAETPGLAVYIDTSIHSIDSAWEKADNFIECIFSNIYRSTAVLQNIREYCWLSSIGIEGSTPDNSRLKLYIRMHTQLPEGIIGNVFPPLSDLGRSGCFAAIMGEKGLSFEDILFCFGFHLVTGELIDIKIDISGSELQMSGDNLAQSVNYCCQSLGLHPIPINNIFDRFNIAVSFIGIGINANRQKRLNIYLKGGSL